jgi:hypothetical protein
MPAATKNRERILGRGFVLSAARAALSAELNVHDSVAGALCEIMNVQ